MQPMTGAPPVPSGASARNAWRELDRDTRRELLRSGHPHPDPTAAVIAVGYARAMLSRSRLRESLPVAAVMTVCVMTLGMVLILTHAASPNTISMVMVAVLVLASIVSGHRIRARTIALHRMESVNSAALWSTERSAPLPAGPLPVPAPSFPASPSGPSGTTGPVVVRYSRRFLMRSFATLAVFAIVVEAGVLWAEGGVLALVVTALLLFAIGLTIYNTLARTRPQLPMLIMTAAGLELPSMEARLAWAEIAELQIHPFRAGRSGRKGRHHVVAFMLTDPEAFRSRLAGWWAKKTRTPSSVYGTPLVIADLALDHSAEQMAAAAAAFTTAPIRRFGP